MEAAGRFLAGRRRKDIHADELLRFALVRAVEIVGEDASKANVETRAVLPSIRPATVSMRNRLIHAYFHIGHDVLWKTAAEEISSLPALLRTKDAISKQHLTRF